VNGKQYVTGETQWRHCIFKKQWKDALAGKDTFTDEERSLVLAGNELHKQYPVARKGSSEGWGPE